jgi:hypothetical protein
MRKKTARPTRTLAPPSFTGSRSSRMNTITEKTASVRNWRFRYAAAPS